MLSLFLAAENARKLVVVASDAAFGGYATSRQFRSAVLGAQNVRADCVIAA
jgi:hypothetical protein